MHEHDDSDRLVDAVQAAAAAGSTLTLTGSGSKARRYSGLQPSGGAAASTLEHVGITYYAPDELVLEARSGTPLALIAEVLANSDQQLAFDPPRFGAGTLGGAVASGLAGPARPWSGAPRDAVLGVDLLNGHGEVLRFGGRVVKNVAGYDVARLQAGAFGTFGCLLSIALRVMPVPPRTATLQAPLAAAEALERLGDWGRASLPLTASSWEAQTLSLRLAGPAAAVEQAMERIGREVGGEARDLPGYWETLRDHDHSFFNQPDPASRLYRASLPLGAAALAADSAGLMEWRGAQRWYWLQPDAVPPVAAQVAELGGYLLPASDPGLASNSQAGVQAISERLRKAFDPAGIFNGHLLQSRGAFHAH